MNKQLTGIKAALSAVGNNQSELARRLVPFIDEDKITPQAIQGWLERNKIPDGRLVAVERATGVDRSILRPDLYAGRAA